MSELPFLFYILKELNGPLDLDDKKAFSVYVDRMRVVEVSDVTLSHVGRFFYSSAEKAIEARKKMPKGFSCFISPVSETEKASPSVLSPLNPFQPFVEMGHIAVSVLSSQYVVNVARRFPDHRMKTLLIDEIVLLSDFEQAAEETMLAFESCEAIGVSTGHTYIGPESAYEKAKTPITLARLREKISSIKKHYNV